MSVRLDVGVPGSGPADSAHRAGISGDNVDDMTRTLRAYADGGMQHVVLALSSGAIGPLASVMETVATKVMPQFR